MKQLFYLILSALLILPAHAQQDFKKQLDNYFKSYRPYGQLIRTASRLQSVNINDTLLQSIGTVAYSDGVSTYILKVAD